MTCLYSTVAVHIIFVNSVGGNNRSEDEVARKWTDLKSQTKLKERKRRRAAKQTGGGPPPDCLLSWEEMIVNALPVEAIEGLKGGIDTFSDKRPVPADSDTEKLQIIEEPSEMLSKEESKKNQSKNGSVDEAHYSTDFHMIEDTETKDVRAKKRKNDATNYQERLLMIEEKKLKLEETRLKLESEKLSVLQKMSEDISKIYCVMKHKVVENDICLEFFEQ